MLLEHLGRELPQAGQDAPDATYASISADKAERAGRCGACRAPEPATILRADRRVLFDGGVPSSGESPNLASLAYGSAAPNRSRRTNNYPVNRYDHSSDPFLVRVEMKPAQ
jgi:hypothetical protein